jgi:FKBP-type peptidyl-prolyl cis-trans isomerase 2
MSQAKQGDTVRVHYTGRLTDGKVFKSSRKHEPLELTLGAGQVIRGLERAIEGMSPGQSKSVDILATEAYGPRQDGKVVEFDRSRLPANIDPELGQQMPLQTKDGRTVPAVVTVISESTVTVDANHPLAGMDLIFDLELVEIV